MAIIENMTLSELKEKLNSLQLPGDTDLVVTIEKKEETKKTWDKQKALEAMKKLKGSGNGRLVDALLKERNIECNKDNLKETSC
ncbi:MAG: hypothetical protein AB1611_01325 [bacterium]